MTFLYVCNKYREKSKRDSSLQVAINKIITDNLSKMTKKTNKHLQLSRDYLKHSALQGCLYLWKGGRRKELLQYTKPPVQEPAAPFEHWLCKGGQRRCSRPQSKSKPSEAPTDEGI